VSSRSGLNNVRRGFWGLGKGERSALGEAAFRRMIALERRRTGRSQKSSMLMLLDMGEGWTSGTHQACLEKSLLALSGVLRETDITGWYKEKLIVGVLLTEIEMDGPNSIPENFMIRISRALKSALNDDEFRQIGLSFHVLPDERKQPTFARAAGMVG
jgi:hypothetical protein